MTENIGLRGEYTLQRIRNNVIVEEINITNLLMESYRTAIINGLLDGTSNINDFEIFYLGIGDDDTEPTRTDTQLGNELFRKNRTSKSEVNGSVVTIWNVTPAEAIFNWRELGVFCGAGATAVPNSGNLLSRVIINFDKTANDTVNIIRRDIINI